MKPAPEPSIANLPDPSLQKDGIGLSTLTVFGIMSRMGRLPPGNRRSRLLPSFEGVLEDYFADRIPPWTMEDAMLAAAALSRKLTVAARNESALRHTGADILNPRSPRATSPVCGSLRRTAPRPAPPGMAPNPSQKGHHDQGSRH